MTCNRRGDRFEIFAKTQDIGVDRSEVLVQGARTTEACLHPDFNPEYVASVPKSASTVTLKVEGPKQATSWHAIEGHTYVAMQLTVDLKTLNRFLRSMCRP